jgi:hypothetical protein
MRGSERMLGYLPGLRRGAKAAIGGLFPLAQIAGAILLVRQPSPLARRVYQGIAWRSGWNHVRELQTISCKPPILVCPTRHARRPLVSITNERYRQLVVPSSFIFREFCAPSHSASWLALGERTRGRPDVITSRVVRAPGQGLSPSRRENRRSLGARDASQACAGVDAGRACSIQAIEALCRLWTQGSTGIEPGTLSHL